MRLWLTNRPDQDYLSEAIENQFVGLHGADLNEILPDSSDEGLAAWFLNQMFGDINTQCVRVTVTNDGQRGAEISI